MLTQHALDRAAEIASDLAVGEVTSWAGTTHVTTSPRGVRQVWLPDWHGAPPEIHPEGLPRQRVIRVSDNDDALAHLHQALDELGEYFAGERRLFSVAWDPVGTPFFQQVWHAVAEVPYGATSTYGTIARVIGAPAASRAVGAANGANPLAPIVPCHRIVASDGRLHDYGPGLPLKFRLLALEGALPASAAEYDAWIARLGDSAPLLGVRSAGVVCRADCVRPRRLWDRAHLIVRSLAEATRTGLRPCPLCMPAAPTLFG
jgi:methylated-DNA-[protein]-cysteine S-methyltransferase